MVLFLYFYDYYVLMLINEHGQHQWNNNNNNWLFVSSNCKYGLTISISFIWEMPIHTHKKPFFLLHFGSVVSTTITTTKHWLTSLLHLVHCTTLSPLYLASSFAVVVVYISIDRCLGFISAFFDLNLHWPICAQFANANRLLVAQTINSPFFTLYYIIFNEASHPFLLLLLIYSPCIKVSNKKNYDRIEPLLVFFFF